MRQTRATLKDENQRLTDELEAAIYALRALARQAADREMLANAHDEPLISRMLGTASVTDFVQGFLDKFDAKRKEAKKA